MRVPVVGVGGKGAESIKIGPVRTTYPEKTCAWLRLPKLLAVVVPTVIVPHGASETDEHLLAI